MFINFAIRYFIFDIRYLSPIFDIRASSPKKKYRELRALSFEPHLQKLDIWALSFEPDIRASIFDIRASSPKKKYQNIAIFELWASSPIFELPFLSFDIRARKNIEVAEHWFIMVDCESWFMNNGLHFSTLAMKLKSSDTTVPGYGCTQSRLHFWTGFHLITSHVLIEMISSDQTRTCCTCLNLLAL